MSCRKKVDIATIKSGRRLSIYICLFHSIGVIKSATHTMTWVLAIIVLISNDQAMQLEYISSVFSVIEAVSNSYRLHAYGLDRA